MKNKYRYFIAALAIFASVLFPAAVLAENSSNTSGSSSSSSSGSDSSDSVDTTNIETENHDMNDRISHFKTAFKVKLTFAEMAHIKLKCLPAQATVAKLHTKFGNSITVRTQAYAELQKNLDALVTKLKAKNVDTTSLEKQISELKTKINTYNIDLTAYKQSLSDLKTVDCKTDPEGFQAALLAARTAHDKLVEDVIAIRSYLVDTLKPSLEAIKHQLESQP